MQRLALLVEYDGTDYAGWQRQSNGMSVQQRLEEACTTAFGVACRIQGAGRTDAGVHARGQVAHAEIPEGAHAIPLEKVSVALNTRLPADIRIRAIDVVHETFHARFNAIWREYEYTISRTGSVFHRRYAWQPDVPYRPDLLSDAMSVMMGRHNFTAISKHNPGTTSYECDVSICELTQYDDRLVARIRANRFVYGMCRAIMGTAMQAARSRINADDIRELLASGERKRAPHLVPACGLSLTGVGYPQPLFNANQENNT